MLFRGSTRDSAGARGERLAARWLRRRGYRILDRNLRIGDDEADVVALDPDGCTLVIVEVKTRTTAEAVPEESVGTRKRFRLARFASRLQRAEKYRGYALRFDVIAVTWPRGERPTVRHHVAAFDSPL